MTPINSIKRNSVENELLVSRTLGRQLSQAIAAALALSERALHRLAAGATLCKSGDHVTRLPFIVSGRLDTVVHVAGKKGEQIVPISFGAGEIAFLSYLFNQLPSGSDLVAGEQTAVKWIPIAEIEAALLKDANVLIMLVRFLGQRLREVQARERAWAARGVKPRLSAGLLRILADLPRQEDGRLIVKLTHEQLASRCGISRPKASIALKALERSGSVVLGRRSIEVLDARLLADLAA